MIEIHPGHERDHDSLHRIQKAALPEYAPELLESGIGGTIGLLVAVDDNPVGYTLFVPGGDAVALLEIAVDPQRQNEGIGSTLLEETCARLDAAGHDTVRLTARASDERVQEFYERHGFTRQERLSDFFETDDGIVYMRQQLTPTPADGSS
jgi:ribosomal protein S18 acetylase RimI-like enzyme